MTCYDGLHSCHEPVMCSYGSKQEYLSTCVQTMQPSYPERVIRGHFGTKLFRSRHILPTKMWRDSCFPRSEVR